MPAGLPRLASVFVALGCASAAVADEPPAEVLPPPRPAMPVPAPPPAFLYSPLMRTVAPAYAFAPYPRRSAYEV